MIAPAPSLGNEPCKGTHAQTSPSPKRVFRSALVSHTPDTGHVSTIPGGDFDSYSNIAVSEVLEDVSNEKEIKPCNGYTHPIVSTLNTPNLTANSSNAS